MIQKRLGAHAAPKMLSLWSSLRRKAEVCFRPALLLQRSAVPALGLPLFVPYLQGHSPTPGSLWGFPSRTLKVAALSPWCLQSHIVVFWGWGCMPEWDGERLSSCPPLRCWGTNSLRLGGVLSLSPVRKNSDASTTKLCTISGVEWEEKGSGLGTQKPG